MLPAVITPFVPRFSANASGDILFVANTLMTAPASDASAASSQAGGGTKLNDNDFTMAYVDVDGVSATFNSSRATLALPAGGSVLFAGLYWGANSTSASRTTAQIRGPGASSYTALTGISLGADSSGNYQAFANVTSLVQAAGVGTYTVANVQANTGADRHAGWALVVVYGDPSAPPRNLTVFDGLAVVNTSSTSATISISGFTAPPTGSVNASVGVVGYEGDLGFTGDVIKLNGTTLADSLNPGSNFFNSSITNKGARVGSKSPDYVNQLGFDADIVSTTGLIANGATSASISLATTNETYLPGVVTTAIDLYAPVVSASKTGVDLNGGSLEPGDVIEYTDTVSVASGEAATGFVLYDAIPANTTYIPGTLVISAGSNAGVKTDGSSDDQAEFDAANNRVVFRLGSGATAASGGSLAVGATSTVRFRVRVNAAAPNGAAIISQATAGFVGQNTGASLTATSSQSSTAVLRRADLALAHSVDVPAPNVLDYVVVTTTLSNAGPFDGSGILVNAALPVGLLFDSVVASQGSYDPSTGVWTAGSLATGAQATLSVRARVVSPTTIATTASIGSAALPDPVSTNNSASATLTPQRAELSLTKTVDVARPNVGRQVAFTTTLTNQGPSAATNVMISDLLPAGFALDSFTAGQGSYDPVAGAWSVGTLASGASVTLVVRADVTLPAPSLATASIVSADQFDPIAGNNAGSAAVTPQQADLVVATGVDNPQPNVGEVITYTVTVTNNGPDAASGVALASTGIPAAVQLLSVNLSQGTFSPATSTWSVGSIPVGATQTLVARAKVLATNIDPLIVSVTGGDQFDPVAGNNTSRSPVTPQAVSLSLVNVASETRPDREQLVTFTVSVRNAGPSAATSVRIGDALPAGLAFVSAATGHGSYDPITGEWTVGTVAPNEVAVLSLVGRVTSPTPSVSTATILGVDQSDDVTSDNESSVAIIPKQADLRLTLDGDDPTPNVGDVETLTLTLSNMGPDTATGVAVAGAISGGVTLLSFVASQGTFDPLTGTWTVGTVNTSTPQTLILQVRVESADPLGGSAAVVASNQYDPNAANDGLSVTAIPQRADLSLAQAVDVPAPNVGDVVAFTLTIANAGPDVATGVRVNQAIPAGFAFVSATPGQGTFDPATGDWDVGALGASASQVLRIWARVTAPGASTAHASVVRSDQYDPDPSSNAASVSVTPQQSNLSLAAAVSDPTPNVGDLVTFTFTLSSSGPNDATGVAVRDLLNAGLELESAVASLGTYDAASATWVVGSVASGSPAVLTLVARVTSPSAFTGSATIVTSDQYDPDAGGNSASVSGSPQVVDVTVAKTVDVARPNVGDIIVLSTVVANNGPSAAAGLLIRSAAGAGLTILSSEVSQGSYDPVTGIWDLGSVAASGVQVLQVTARVVSPNAIVSSASVAALDQYDSVPGNAAATVTLTPQRSDVVIDQTVDVASPNVGQLVTFTITVSAFGPDAATGVRVSQALPAGFQFVASTASSGGYDPAVGVWTVGTVTPGTPRTLQVVARVTAPATAPVVATLASADQFDPNPANNSASTATDPQQADVAVAASFDVSRPNVGDLVVYTIRVRDVGPSGATGLVVSAPLPAGLTFVSAAAGQGTYDSSTGLWGLGDLAAGALQVLHITARVDGPTAMSTLASVVAADQFDPNAGNNGGAATLTPQRSDLSLAFVSDASRPNVGQVVTLTLTLANAGPDPATGVVASMPIPAGLSFLDAVGPGVYDAATGVWSPGVVAQGVPAVLTIRVRVDAPSSQVLTASVSAAVQYDPSSANDSSSIGLTPRQADLAVAVSVDHPAPNVGDLVTLTVVATNLGADDATGVRIADVLPAGLAFVSSNPSQGVYSFASGVWEAGHITPGGAAVLTIRARVVSPAPSVVTSSVLGMDQFDPTASNDVSSASLAPQAADLALSAVVDAATPNVGGVATVTLTLANAGPDAATGVQIASAVPDGYTLAGAAPSMGDFDPATGRWNLASLAAGATATLTLSLIVWTPGAATYSASIVASAQYDADRSNGSAAVTITPQRSDLAIAASVSDPAPNVGDPVTFTFTISSAGPDLATGVVVSAPLPAGYAYSSSAAGQGAYDSATGLWSIGAVAPGVPITLSLVALVADPSPPAVTATITAVDQYDPIAGDGSASASVSPQRADLGVAVVVSNATPNVGETIVYTIYLTNTGPDAATSIVLRDVLPAGVTFALAGPGTQDYDPATGLWNVGSLPAGGQIVLTLSAIVDDPDATVNRVEIDSVDQYDPSDANDAAETSTEPQQSELRLTAVVDQARPNVGDTVVVTLTLANLGFDDATGVVVDASLPAGLTLASGLPDHGTYDPATGLWSLAGLFAGSSATLTLTAVVSAPAVSPFAASIQRSDQFDPNLANNSASLRVSPRQADLDVSAAVSSTRPNVGDLIVLSVTVVNHGPDEGTNVTVSSLLPPGLTFVSSTPGLGSYDPVGGEWAIVTLAAGASATLTITARVDSASPLTGGASITAVDQYDPDPSDVASVVILPRSSGLTVAATVDVATPRVGDTVAIMVTLTNSGPDAATGVAIGSVLPAGLTLVSAEPSQGVFDPATGVWSLNAVGVGTSTVLVLRARVVSPDPAAVAVSVGGSDQYDPDAADDSASVVITPGQTNLATTLAADTTAPDVGEVVTLTVTLSNTGPVATSGAILLGALSPGLVFVGAEPSQGSFSPSTGTWIVGEVAPGQSPTMQIRVRVVSPDVQSATILIGAADQYDPNPADNSASIALIPRQADLSLISSVDAARPNVGDLVTITLSLVASGPDGAGNVRVASPLPSGLAFVSSSGGVGSYDPSSGVWTVGAVTVGSTSTLQIVARVVDPNASVATSTILPTGRYDPDAADDAASATIIPQRADLSINATSNNLTPDADDVVTYTIVLSNNGPDAATGVVATNLLPPGLAFISATAVDGSYDAATSTWNVGSIGVGANATLLVRVRAASAAPSLATVSVIAADQFGAADGVKASVAVLPQQSDVAVAVAVDDATPDLGDEVVLTITVRNQGPDGASGVVVAVPLPAGLAFVSALPGQGSYDPATGLWTLGSLPSSGTSVLRIRASVAVPTASTIAATLVELDQSDLDGGNDAATVTLNPTSVGLSVQVRGVPSAAAVGQLVTIRVVVANSGASLATGVHVPVNIPPGFRLVASTPGQGTLDPAAGLWTVGAIPTGGSAELTLVLEAVAPGVATMTAGSIRSDQYDGDPSNDSWSASVTIAAVVDLQVQMRGVPAGAAVGDRITLEIDLSNSGSSATGVNLPVSIPSGFRLISARPGQGSFDVATGRWALGTVPTGTSSTLTLVLEAVMAGELAIAVGPARADQADVDASNDATSAALTVRPVAQEPAPAMPTAVLRGAVFTDLDGDGNRDPGEPGIQGESVVLTGTDASGNPLTRSVTTGADGEYQFDELPAGSYSLLVAGFGLSLVGSPGDLGGTAQGGRISGILLTDGAIGGGYGFFSPAPRQPSSTGVISGTVYLDLDRNGVFGRPDYGVATVRVVLSGVDDSGAPVMLETTTAADGTFSFQGLLPGVYSLSQSSPGFLRSFRTTVGTAGGTVRGDSIREIRLEAEDHATGYGFATLPAPGCRLAPLVARRSSPGSPAELAQTGRPRFLPKGPLIHRFLPGLSQASRNQRTAIHLFSRLATRPVFSR
ncbi:SdrD B-like domain-containing protein [Paludisphaera soli]|uniref:SdrD B-like domain-containing protein n=1 Tax=Paludisphaera soli TaxID=2712865 RepID=UPI0013EB438A|nr:SdrD B-like domain-containing protein [Paludisphaera soli]